MSTYPFWSLKFDMRPDVEAVTRRVLTAVAGDVRPRDDDLQQLHPVPRHYLADWRRMLSDEVEPMIGPPVRLSSDRRATEPASVLSIEFSQHDDEFANGGYLFWLWVLRLVARPTDEFRHVIGLHGLYRGDYDTKLVYADRDGIVDYHRRMSFDELEDNWHALVLDQDWTGWSN